MKNISFQKVKLFSFPCEENNYRPSILDGRFLLYLALALVILKFVSLFYFTILPRTPFFADVSRGALVQMANDERSSAGLAPLIENPKLTEAARLKAQDMLQRDYFSHWSPDGTSPWHWFGVAGYDYKYAGENLAIGFLDAKDVHRAWIDSPTHRDNILGSNYSEIGIAVVEGEFYGQRTYLVVQVFGYRDTAVHSPIAEVPVSSIVIEEILAPSEEEIPSETIIEKFGQEELPTEEESEEKVVLGDYDSGIYLSGQTMEAESMKISIFKFLMVRYDDIIKQIIFFSMMFLGFVLVINIFVKFDVQHPDLIFRGLFFLLLFLVFDYFDQMTLVRMVTETPWIG